MINNKRRKSTVFKIILFVLTGAYIAFIWIHSTMDAKTSTGESTLVLEFLTNFFKSIGISAQLTDHIIRKSAHFCEFALLGCLTLWCGYLINKNIVKNLMSVGFVYLFVAVIDEYIQLFSAGRSCEVKDVLLDFTGSICGATFFIVIIIIILLVKKRKISK
ncbi:MAG: VanZ family protein [Ruminococcus sp.]|nr:VanZ family protein [Ruminococcus sp.]